jgi:hypothetical protein
VLRERYAAKEIKPPKRWRDGFRVQSAWISGRPFKAAYKSAATPKSNVASRDDANIFVWQSNAFSGS